jgi:hypothetical protein
VIRFLIFIGVIITAIGYAINRKAVSWIWIILIIVNNWYIGTNESMIEPYIKAVYSE